MKKTAKPTTTTKKIASVPNVGDALIGNVTTFLRRFVSFPTEGQAEITALWIAGTYLADVSHLYPYLAITATTRGAGKTTLLQVIAGLVAQPERGTGASMAALLAMVALGDVPDATAPTDASGRRLWNVAPPTILSDEGEKISPNTRQFFNSGYKAGDTINKTNAKNELVRRPSYCPKLFALIGSLPEVLEDRCVSIELSRVAAPPEDYIPVLYHEEAQAIRAQLMLMRVRALTRRANGERLVLFAPDARMIARAREIWGVMFAVAKFLNLSPEMMNTILRAAEQSETTKGRKIGISVQAERDTAESLKGWKLLQDAATVSGELPTISTAGLIERLRGVVLGGWSTLTPEECARMLGRYGLRPETMRAADRPKVEQVEVIVLSRHADGTPNKTRDKKTMRHPLAKGYDAAKLRTVAADAIATGQLEYLKKIATAVSVESDPTME